MTRINVKFIKPSSGSSFPADGGTSSHPGREHLHQDRNLSLEDKGDRSEQLGIVFTSKGTTMPTKYKI